MQPFFFDVNEFLPRRVFDRVTEIRVDEPQAITERARLRRKRTQLTRDGKLTLLAVDHPARGVLRIGSDEFAMGNRHELLARTIRVLLLPEWDGVLATPDIIEDLYILNHLVVSAGGGSFLDDKVLIGTMQRGGIAGYAGEIDDRFTGYTAEEIARQHLDGGKMLLRFVEDDERTLHTIEYCALAVTQLHRLALFAFIEPLPYIVLNGQFVLDTNVASIIRVLGIASALGESSQYTWFKIPYVENFERVTLATTLPILMLGGESENEYASMIENFAVGMRARPNVRGVLVGRKVLFPGDDDPFAVGNAINRIVHDGSDARDSIDRMDEDSGREMDALTGWLI